MSKFDDLIATLREALAVSPHNLPLRRHLAETLLKGGRAAEAEAEYRAVVAQESTPAALLGLAEALAAQSKTQEGLSILTPLLEKVDGIVPARAFLVRARLLLQSGETARSIGDYLQALDRDPALADPDLAQRLGLLPDGETNAAPPMPPPSTDKTGVDKSDKQPRVPAGSIADDVEAWMMGEQEDDESEEEEEGGELASLLERPGINFTDVGGMEAVKDEIRLKIIHPLTHPELYAAYGKRPGGGILLYGPPGCGKTYLARATAGEVRARFVTVGINDVLDMWLGNSERNLHEIFELARRNKPCVLFFDEVDALGASRSDLRRSAGRQVINQFLSELDGVKQSNEGILVLAATNAPWHLDSAFRRPGRFDRILFVPPPDTGARAEILKIVLREKPTENVDVVGLAKNLKDFSGADLQALVDVAVEAKLREAMKAGRPSPLTTKDLQQAAKAIKPTTKEWFTTARNYALYANEAGLYDEILRYLGMG